MSFTIGSLFDGSGGFPLAAFMAGGVPVWASEIEPYPIAVTKSRFPYVKHLGSVTDINGAEIDPVDVISFGSPCQDLSVAGKRAGLKHEANGDEETTRSGLFMEAVRIIKEMREKTNGVHPRIAVWENVPGAFSSNKGEDFRIVCEELIKIVEPSASMPPVPKNGWAYADCYVGDGWSLAYRVFDAQHWGVPQRRRRIYLVADFRGQRAGKVLFERDGVRGYFETGRTPGQATPSDAKRSIGADDREGESVSLNDCVGADIYNLALTGDVVGSLTAGGNTSTGSSPKILQPVTLEPGIARREGGHIYEGVCGTLRANAGDNQMSVAYSPNIVLDDQGGQQITVRTDGQAPTLRAETHGNLPCVMEPVVYNGENITHPLNKTNPLPGDPCHTLGTDSRNYLVSPIYCIDQGGGKSGANVHTNKAPTLCTTHGGEPAVSYPPYLFENHGQDVRFKGPLFVAPTCQGGYGEGGSTKPLVIEHQPPKYIVRRLTPVECARLQGFPDKWGHPDQKDDLTDEEYQFWLNVRNTHAAINGKTTKDHTKQQMLTWYNKLHTDSSEYKMWGNGIALPNALYVMQGIAEVFANERN